LDPIEGIVDRGDVPPTAEYHPLGVNIRFYKHNPRLVEFNHSSLLAGLVEGAVFDEEHYVIVVMKKIVKITLKKPEMGHGTIKLRKSEFIRLIDG
jgi:hypothetical protein